LTPPDASQNLNASLRDSDRRSGAAAAKRNSFSASAIQSYSPPVRILGTGRRSYSGGYRLDV
jgi:hypothetical protein